MIWLRTFTLGLLLVVGSSFADYESNPFLHGFANDVNAFIQDQKNLAAVDSGAGANPDHSVTNRAIDGYAAPTYLPPAERRLICAGNQVCVSQFLCAGGYFTSDLPLGKQECIPDVEVCCTYRPPPPPPPPKPTTPPAVPCGRFQACVPPSQCYNGLYSLDGPSTPPYAQTCYAPDVCCRIPDPEPVSLTDDGYVVRVPQIQLPTPTIRPIISTPPPPPPPRPFIPTTTAPIYLPPDRIPQPTIIKGENQLSYPINPPPKNVIDDPIANLPVGCPAALNCTEIQYCTAGGVMSKSVISLTPEEEAYRVPMTDCQDPVKGIIGKCCRDPDYVDPWPVSQLGQYTDPKLFGDDGQYRPAANQLRPQIAPRPVVPIRDPGQYQINYSPRPVNPSPLPSFIPSPSPSPIAAQYTDQLGPAIFSAPATCGTRNPNGTPAGPGPFDASFSEYPWQAMVLREATKTILCGGIIVANDLVLTSASCIQGYQAFDILVKGGEWKLGRDEEPLKFQLIRAARLEVHPSNGLALIYLETAFKLGPHINPICLDSSDVNPSDNCVTTGWGQQATSIHLQDAVMHHSPVSIVSPDQCTASGNGYQYGPGIICGAPQIDACELDVGSALACVNPQGQYVLKGVYLSSSPCGSQPSTISFSKSDLGWIKGSAPAANAIPPFRPVTNEYLPPRH